MKAVIVGIVAILLAAGAGATYFYNQSPQNSQSTAPEASRQIEKQEIDSVLTIDSNLAIGSDIGKSEKHGFHDFYSEDGWGYSNADKRVLFFFASWCPTCIEADKEFKANLTRIPENVDIYIVHYNDPETFPEDKTLAQKYGITYQHTFVQVDKEGKEITKWNGGGLDNLLSKVK